MEIVTAYKMVVDTDMERRKNTFVNPTHIHKIYRESVDVYSADGRLLAKLRKNVLSSQKLRAFSDATYKFTRREVSGNRGNTCGSSKRNVYNNPRVKSAIIGYFDRWGPEEKAQFRSVGVRQPLEVRETRFSANFPDKFTNTLPLLHQINSLYRRLVPSSFKRQNRKAKETHFTIGKTAFTTVTTNINFQTAIHKDRGDDEEGFGNLAVVERGRYKGGEICLPQYGIGFDVRHGDILFMDVHEWHGNLPIVLVDKDAVRMSIVCYLRTNVWRRTRRRSAKFKSEHLNRVREIKAKAKATRKIRRK